MPTTQIYFVETKSDEQKRLLCRWVEHFYEEGRKVQVVTDGALGAQQLDQLLWTFSQASFVPHRIVSSPNQPPGREAVAVTAGEVPLEGYHVVVCDGPVSREFLGRFPLALHFVLLDDAQRREHSRALWQWAREQGHTVRHIPQGAGVSPLSGPP